VIDLTEKKIIILKIPTTSYIFTMTKSGVLLVYNSSHSLHDGRMNECAARVDAVVDELKTSGLWDQCRLLDVAVECPPLLLSQEQATTAVTAIHTIAHLQRLRSEYASVSAKQWNCMQCTFGNEVGAKLCAICGATRRRREGENSNFIIPENKSNVYLCEKSLDVTLSNCAGCITAAWQVLNGHVASGFCLVRPPGHHASSESFGSYCLINAVAVTAKAVLTKVGKDHNNKTASDDHGDRILILDWDVHHGDGTQAVIENDLLLKAKCRFVSIHRHDVHFWPKSGTVEQGGESAVNIPLTGIAYGDADYYYILESVVLPLARRWNPSLILVSAGYDCAQGDPLGRFAVTPTGFARMSRMLLEIAPSLFILEGGYDVDGSGECPHKSLRTGVAATVESLLAVATGDLIAPLPENWRDGIRPETKDVVTRVQDRLTSQGENMGPTGSG
jgi:acetoin utilization deacetylase AcuC-like enzyme